MIRGREFIHIYNDHFIAHDIMAHVVYIVYNYIVTKITANDRTVVQAHRNPYVVERQIKGFKLSDTYKTKKFAVLNKFRIESIRHQNIIPIIGGVPVAYQYFYFVGR